MTEKAQGPRASFLLLLFLLVLAAVTGAYLLSPGNTPGVGSAVALQIVRPPTAKVGERVTFEVRAVDNQGRVDPRRNDLVRISLNQGASADLSAPLLYLRGGVATFTIQVHTPQTITVFAAWLSGYSTLDSATAVVVFQP